MNDTPTPRTDQYQFNAIEWMGEIPGANRQTGNARVVRADFARTGGNGISYPVAYPLRPAD
jgi:hypothetical protein